MTNEQGNKKTIKTANCVNITAENQKEKDFITVK